jgi:mRNA interferase RelE/StbE
MKFTILKRPRKFLENLPLKESQRIFDAMFKLPEGDVVKLEGEKDGFRLRVGRWRVVYQRLDNEIIIRDIGPRGDVYK